MDVRIYTENKPSCGRVPIHSNHIKDAYEPWCYNRDCLRCIQHNMDLDRYTPWDKLWKLDIT